MQPEYLINEAFKQKDIQSFSIDLVQGQLWDGVDGRGEGIYTKNARTGVYAFTTERYKQEAGQPYNRVTLRDTGAFWDSIYFKHRKNLYEISGQFDKPDGNILDNLDTIFHKQILGLNFDSLQILKEKKLMPFFRRH